MITYAKEIIWHIQIEILRTFLTIITLGLLCLMYALRAFFSRGQKANKRAGKISFEVYFYVKLGIRTYQTKFIMLELKHL